MQRIYKTFSGYTHAHYPHIMEIYGGREPSFKILGVSSPKKYDEWKQLVDYSYNAVLNTTSRITSHYELTEFRDELISLKQ